ncbi:hypothetical protein ACVWXN_006804 [Bradyrhizobium sp. i1.4.4]
MMLHADFGGGIAHENGTIESSHGHLKISSGRSPMRCCCVALPTSMISAPIAVSELRLAAQHLLEDRDSPHAGAAFNIDTTSVSNTLTNESGRRRPRAPFFLPWEPSIVFDTRSRY